MRGTGGDFLGRLEQARFIPAHAGNGDERRIEMLGDYGSSPRMRGTAL